MSSDDFLNRRKEDFLRIVSHQLRTPLTSLHEGISQVLEGLHGPLNETQTKFLSLCMQDVDRLTVVVENLLDISTIYRGQLSLTREKIDMCDVARETISFFASQIQSKGLTGEVNCHDHEALYVYADCGKLREVFKKLLENALSFTEKGKISVDICQKNDMIECTVSDTGGGISKEYQQKVFETFEQLVLHSLGGGEHVGLGLAIAKGIVEAHDGEIWIDSEASQGAAIRFVLPRYSTETILHEAIRQEMDTNPEVSVIIFSFEIDTDNRKVLFDALDENLKKNVRKGIDRIIAQKDTVHIIIPGADNDQGLAICTRMRGVIETVLSKEGLSATMKLHTLIFNVPGDGKTFEELWAKIKETTGHQGELDRGGIKMEGDKKKILVVDDEENVSIMTVSRLRSSGFDVVSAPNGREGLRMAQRENPDLILLDVVMPDIDGYKVLAKLKDSFRTKQIPVIMFTAENRIGDVTNAIEMGAEDYIIKPFTTEVLMEKIGRVLHKIEMRKQKELEERQRQEREREGEK